MHHHVSFGEVDLGVGQVGAGIDGILFIISGIYYHHAFEHLSLEALR